MSVYHKTDKIMISLKRKFWNSLETGYLGLKKFPSIAEDNMEVIAISIPTREYIGLFLVSNLYYLIISTKLEIHG